MIRANDRVKLYWDGLILVFALLNSLSIPLVLAFDQIEEEFSKWTAYIVIDGAANVFFIIDIIVQMNTTYYDSDGEEVFKKSRIMKNYLCGMFPVDLLSSIPFELLTPWVSPIILFY